jgi:hypothetical protein
MFFCRGFIKEAYNQKGPGVRERRAKIVNAAVKREKGGSYVLDVKNPHFTAIRTRYDDHYGKDVKKGKPRALMEAKLGTKERFDQALADGDIVEIIDKGKKFYQYRELEVAHVKGKKKEGRTEREMPMTDEQEKEWNDCLEALNWNFEVSDAVEETLALGDVPKKVTKAMEKAYKQIMEQVKKSQKLCDAFKGTGSSLGSSGMIMVDKLKSALVDTKTSGHTLDTFITMGVDEAKGTLTVSAVKGKLNEAAVHLKELLTQTKFCKTLLSK